MRVCAENRGAGGRAKTPTGAAAKRKNKAYDKRVVAEKSSGEAKGRKLELYAERLYVLIDVAELKYWLEVSSRTSDVSRQVHATLAVLHQSPSTAAFRGE